MSDAGYGGLMTALPTLRDRAREAVRDEVSRQAWRLFGLQGYAATTVDEIAEASGMSRRTFFRYFGGKDELVRDRLDKAGEEVAEALFARPPDERAWTALRRAFDVNVALQERHVEATRPLLLMLRDESALRAVLVDRRRRWVELLVPEVTRRIVAQPDFRSVPQPDPRSVAITAAAIACLESAQELWARGGDRSLAGLLDESMGAVADLGFEAGAKA